MKCSGLNAKGIGSDFLMEDEDGTKQLIHSVRYLSDTAF